MAHACCAQPLLCVCAQKSMKPGEPSAHRIAIHEGGRNNTDKHHRVLVHSLPGSRTERAMLTSFARMYPELLRFSSSAELLQHVPEELQSPHRSTNMTMASVVTAPQPPKENVEEIEYDDELDDNALELLGL